MNVFEEVKKLDFPLGQYVVVGSAVMAAHSIREANDVDIVVTPELFEQCKNSDWELKPWTKPGRQNSSWLKKGNVDLYIEFLHYPENLTAKDLLKDSEMINGVPFVTLRSMIGYKKEYGRPKDFEDAELIEQFIKNKQ